MILKFVKLIFAFFLTINITNGSQYLFKDYITKYNKSYSSSEFLYRYNIFQENLDKISQHNSENHHWKMGINQFTDWTPTEFNFYKSDFKHHWLNNINQLKTWTIQILPNDLPDDWDWVEKGAVTNVKNQGQCGSCWSFSSTGALEGANFIKNKKLISLSEQELVDCSQSFGNMGCNGGLMNNAFKYVMKNGLCTEKSYNYTGKIDGTCHKNNCKSVINIRNYIDVIPNNPLALQQSVYLQPVSIAIEADQTGFQFYSHGVYTGNCGTNLDHGVLLVGWGEINGKQYWKVKNSWGPNWGDNGYILLEKNKNQTGGQCGILLKGSYPVM